MRLLGLVALSSFVIWTSGCGEDSPATDVGGQGGASTGGSPTSSGGAPATGGAGAGGTPIPDIPPNWQMNAITTWRGNAKAAYTIVHDDACMADSHYDLAAPALDERGLRASFGAIAGNCDDQWDDLEDLRASGHEVMSHSTTHPNLTELEYAEALAEIDDAEDALEAHLSGLQVEFFIFPLDAFDDPLLAYLKDSGYAGARGGERGHNPSNFADDFRLRFDVYGPGFSIYGGREGSPCEGVEPGDGWGSASSACRLYVLNQYVDDVIADSGYGIRELHGLEGDAWEPVPTSEYEQHLDHVATKIQARELWMDTASTVIRYRRGREACALPVSAGDGLYFATISADCQRYATTLSFRIAPLGAAPAGLTATQDGEPVTVHAEAGGTFLVDADPTAGPVLLSPN